jgi:hypothetical protein
MVRLLPCSKTLFDIARETFIETELEIPNDPFVEESDDDHPSVSTNIGSST